MVVLGPVTESSSCVSNVGNKIIESVLSPTVEVELRLSASVIDQVTREDMCPRLTGTQFRTTMVGSTDEADRSRNVG